MKTNQLLFLISVAALPVIFFSCKKTKSCPATDLNTFPSYPYSPNQEISFKDSFNNEISIRMNPNFDVQPEYEIILSNPGSLKSFDNENTACGERVQLYSQRGISTDTLFENTGIGFDYQTLTSGSQIGYKHFRISYPNYNNISGYFSASGEMIFENNCIKLASYKTPYKTYQNVYENIPSTDYTQYWKKFVFDDKGRLLAFNAGIKDTLRFFYIVE